MQSFVTLALVVVVSIAAWRVHANGYEKAEIEARLQASERVRMLHRQADQNASEERAGRRAAEVRAQQERSRGDALARQAQDILREQANTELCPVMCYDFEWTE